MAMNVLGRSGDDRAKVLWPDGMGRGPRVVKAVTGVWRTRLGKLYVIESSGKLVAKDGTNRMVGAVMRGADGRAVVKGVFRGSTVKGTFEWMIESHGQRLSGVWRTAVGGQGAIDAIKESNGVPQYLVQELVSSPGLGGGFEGVRYCDAKALGVKIGRVPCGWEGVGPGGSTIKIDRKGVQVGTEEAIEQGQAPAPEESAADRGKRHMKVALVVAGVAAVIGLFSMRRRSPAPA